MNTYRSAPLSGNRTSNSDRPLCHYRWLDPYFQYTSDQLFRLTSSSFLLPLKNISSASIISHIIVELIKFLPHHIFLLSRAISRFQCFLVIISFIIIVCATSKSDAILIQGSAIKCLNEGESVEVSFVFKDPCIECRCSNQVIVCKKVKCYYERCKTNTKCLPGQKLIHKKGHYCPVCTDVDGYCRVQGEPFSVINFDGLKYDYNGIFNHVLARDCKTKEFSIHVINRFDPNFLRYNTSLMHTSFNAIAVRLKKIKVRLTRYGVKIGRKLVDLPYNERGLISIVRQGKKIGLRASNGLRLTWDGHYGIQVAIPIRFKKRTCGLCGNFNGQPDDDTITKRGAPAYDVNTFFKSWKLKPFRKRKRHRIDAEGTN